MVVGCCVAVVTVKGAAVLKTKNLALFHQDIEIPVHGTQAQMREVRAELVVDFLSGRMARGGFEQLKYSIPLFAFSE
jgi:ABC-type transporter Mla maintaining outer membrane lipid asymmetry ATPase subunit MlaF